MNEAPGGDHGHTQALDHALQHREGHRNDRHRIQEIKASNDD